ncbi:MAG: NADP-dependent oxidoreductase [Deltaproteobacteria bacterium]
MKAVIAPRYGAAVEVAEVTEPEMGPRDVRIAVRAASLNPLDFKIRDGKVKLVLRLKPPVHLGCDAAGVVEAIGSEVTRFAVGDEVFVRLEKLRMGGLAERVCADEGVVAKKPTNTTFGQAAAIPLVGLTALQAMRDVAAVQPGQRILIQAGAGGVGCHAIQIAKKLGLWVATTTSTKNIAFAQQLGADRVIDYTKQNLRDALGPDDQKVDAVFDTLGAQSELDSLAITKRGGIVVGVGGMPDAAFANQWLPGFARPVVWFATRKRRAAVARTGARFAYLFMRPDGTQLAELASWIESGALVPQIYKTYPLAGVREAFAELERGRARGKIVIEIG